MQLSPVAVREREIRSARRLLRVTVTWRRGDALSLHATPGALSSQQVPISPALLCRGALVKWRRSQREFRCHLAATDTGFLAQWAI